VLDIPKDDLVIKGIKNKNEKLHLIGSNQDLNFKHNCGAAWMGIPGVFQVTLTPEILDQNVTVIAIDLDTPLDLYRGEGGAVEAN
jgi:alpha-L-fucosidase